MTPEQWSAIEDHFGALAGTDPDERAHKLAAIADPEVRKEVASLLANASDDATATARGAIAGVLTASFSTPEPSLADRKIGPYRLIRRLGQGGQGTVFEAIRDDGTFHQRVAIKVVKWELDSTIARERFRHERQILAGIEHPYVARLLDGGQTEDGSPYLVMEYVQGHPLTAAAAEWPLRRKLEVFLKVCAAVEHAHRNLIVHRDLKPANILVSAGGEPKLLDFGIAKLLDPEATRTETGSSALTPEYASPEQVRGQPVTTASDVYSLGVVLYQLLTGRKPYTLETATAAEMDRVICVDAPAAPGLGDELDHILLMALRKEPERRYASVERLADDIESYLANRPVMARPDTFRYRSTKYVRRHWIGVLAAAIALAGICGGAEVAVYQARVARRQFNDVRYLANRFLFEFDAKIAYVPGTLEAREMVVSTALEYLNRLSREAAGDPGLEWELAVAYGKVALVQGSFNAPSLRRPRDAAVSYEKSFALARPLMAKHWLNREQQATLVGMLMDAEIMHRYNKDLDLARRLGQEAIDDSAGLTGWTRDKAILEMALTLGAAGDLVGNEKGLAELVPAIRETARAEPSYENRQRFASLLYNLGVARMKLTAFPEALAAENEALPIFQALAAERPRDVRVKRYLFQTFSRFGDITGAVDRPSLGKTLEAAAFYERSIAVMEPLGNDPHDVSSRIDIALVENKAAATLALADPRRAQAHAERVLELVGNSRDAALSHALALGTIATTYVIRRDLAQAEQYLRKADEIAKSTGNKDPNPILLLAWMRLEIARGHTEAAAADVRQMIALEEGEYKRERTPESAWHITEDLKLGIPLMPDSAQQFRARILAVWKEQNERFPGHPWIGQRLAEAQSATGR